MSLDENRSKIVVAVDDQELNILLLQGVLTRAGYTFFGFVRPSDAMSLLLKAQPKLILLDVQMPEMDGYEMCRRLRKMPQFDTVPIAFLTARKSPDDVREGLAAGGNDFIIKPWNPGRLLERVRLWTTRGLPPRNAS